ncbi:unnamed protein product [Boreogadus saida]
MYLGVTTTPVICLERAARDDTVPAEREPGEVVDSLVGKQVEYAKEDGGKRSGMVIHQVEAKPSVYFIKFDDDFHIYVYDLVKTS